MAYISAYQGVLVLPDGVEIATGGSCDPDLTNAAISQWIADGWLVPELEPLAEPDTLATEPKRKK